MKFTARNQPNIAFSFLVLVFCFTLSISAQTKTKNIRTVKISYTRTYCGGAKPSPEIMFNLNQPKKLANCVIKLVDSTNIKAKPLILKTNDSGEVTLNLPNGKYLLYIGSNAKNKATLPFNKKCKKLQNQLLKTIHADEEKEVAEIRIPCDPCDDLKKLRP
jgi:hypothetical protein